MKNIYGKERQLVELLDRKKYSVQYYQREYRWGTKQIEELLDDLVDEFNLSYRDEYTLEDLDKYDHYYLGSIVLSAQDNEVAIIDGQQRLSSITLLLIYLNNLQASLPKQISLDNLIFSELHLKKSFNIYVPERDACLNALYNNQPFDDSGQSESVRNIHARYKDIEALFPDEIKENALLNFIEWLMYKVYFVEIKAQTEQDAHKIFVTMNDRGLSLTPAEMLKGYLLSEIRNDTIRNTANDLWRKTVLNLKDLGKNEDEDFLKNWLRAQYAQTIREKKKGAVNQDWDIIGTTFHKWVRENSKEMGLIRPEDFERFVLREFKLFADTYISLKSWSALFNHDQEYVFYNANRNFTLQYQVVLAAIDPNDTTEIINQKVRLVSCFLDQFIAIRVFNFKTVDYSTIRNYVFSLTLKVRRKSVAELSKTLLDELLDITTGTDPLTLAGIDRFYLNNFTSRYMRHILARITHYVEKHSRLNTEFTIYVDRENTNPFDVEHILSDTHRMHDKAFPDEDEFKRQRNRFGALLLLPQDKNRSFQNKPFEQKVELYLSENLLAKSLNKLCYQNNPHFISLRDEGKLPFKFLDTFGESAIDSRQTLYREIAKRIWNPQLLAVTPAGT